MDIIPINLNEAADQAIERSAFRMRVGIAMRTIELLRTTGVLHSCDGMLPPVERTVSDHERRAYNNSLDFIANFVSGELEAAGTDLDDDDLPGPDMAVRYPRVTNPTSGGAFPAPEMVSTGTIATNH